VHCHGTSSNIHSEDWLLRHIEELTNDNELTQEEPWKVSDAPEQIIKAMVKGIVGIRFKVAHMEGVLKMNQPHIEDNRLGVIAALTMSSNPQDQKVAAIMQELEKC
jgi:transcriptional regulator